jgi:hypothetical protein
MGARFVLRVEARPGVPGGPSVYQRLRGWLKEGLHTFDLRCLDIHQEAETKKEIPMPIDLNEVEPDRELIEPGIYGLRIAIKEGHGGKDGWLKLAKNQRSLMLQLECKVIAAVTKKGELTESEHNGKVVRDWITLEFDETDALHLPAITTAELERFRTSVRLGRKRLRAVIDSAYGLDPKDDSDEAQEKRRLKSYDELNGLTFYAQIEERAGQGKYGPSNTIDFVITPDLPDYPKQESTVVAWPPKRSIEEELDDIIPNFGNPKH